MSPTLEPIARWYDDHARALPWRSPAVTPWQVLVSEVMLQQTPVSRVLPVYDQWVRRWPKPADLASAPVGDAIRQWGRLGYPRRATRLHASAVVCRDHHGGQVPSNVYDLRALPGVGEYTAAAVAAFAFRQRHAVLDTNVRRVYARLVDGQAFEQPGSITVGERRKALDLLPADGSSAAHVSIAVMELGALVCTARKPECEQCPVAGSCAWYQAGRPEWQGPQRKGQTYEGTDRQCRGRVLAELRDAQQSLTRRQLDDCWHEAAQLERALVSLAGDGLIELEPASGRTHDRRYRLPN